MTRRTRRNGTLESLAKLDAWFDAAEQEPEPDPIAADLIAELKDAILDELRQCNDPNALVSALAALRVR